MLVLRAMRPEEYPAYSEYFIADYGREIAENYGHPIDAALELAKKELQHSFPDGVNSPTHSLLCMDAEIQGKVTLVGYLWHALNAKEHSSFIYDIYVFDAYRGQGFGKQAITVLERQLQEAGIHQIKLRVAYHNQRAFKLYQEIGFVITGVNMSKNLGNA